MNRRTIISGAAAGAVTMAVPVVTKGATTMINEARTYIVKGTYAIDAVDDGDTGSPAMVGVRLAAPGSPSWGPGGRTDEMTIVVSEADAPLWQYGKTFTMTITES